MSTLRTLHLDSKTDLTKTPSRVLRIWIRLRRLLHLHRIVDDQVHELVKTLHYLSATKFRLSMNSFTHPDLALYSDSQLLV